MNPPFYDFLPERRPPAYSTPLQLGTEEYMSFVLTMNTVKTYFDENIWRKFDMKTFHWGYFHKGWLSFITLLAADLILEINVNSLEGLN